MSALPRPIPKVAIVGCGALGSFYGARLARAGLDVHFLLRSDLAAVRQHGVQVASFEGSFTSHPKAAATPADIGPCDAVVVALKTTANDALPALLPPLVGPSTVLVTLQNGLGNEEALEALFPHHPILGGLCFVCINRTAPGIIHHIAHGRILLGAWRSPISPQARDVAGWFQRADITCDLTDDLMEAHWRKLAWNIPFNGLSVASCVGLDAYHGDATHRWQQAGHCLTTDLLLADPGWAGVVRDVMRDVIQASNALGFPIPREFADEQVRRTLDMGAYKPSTMIDFEEGRPLELDALFLLPLAHARRAGLPVPAMSKLAAVLEALSRKPPLTHATPS
ncbi:MAG: 2-dehydropantoate 2-reductase [Verrucomicrobiota bacterium]